MIQCFNVVRTAKGFSILSRLNACALFSDCFKTAHIQAAVTSTHTEGSGGGSFEEWLKVGDKNKLEKRRGN